MSGFKELYRRNLPHWQPRDSIFFITFRLARSLPQVILLELRNEEERERQSICARSRGEELRIELYNCSKKFFGKYDAWLDQCDEGSPRWLVQENIARLVMQEIHLLDAERYHLIAFCIMPNHVHLLIDSAGLGQVSAIKTSGTTHPYPVTDSLRLLNGRTARSCNQALGRAGDFWHHESYDHVVRDEQEFERIFGYILGNPVKAKLVSAVEDWPFTYTGRDELDLR
jgi:putative transposase